MRIRTLVLLALFVAGLNALAADRVSLAPTGRSEESTVEYLWQRTPVGQTAELIILLCKNSQSAAVSSEADVPLISVLRDTLGDGRRENDRISYVWLLGLERPNLGRRILSGVPFFYWRVGRGSGRVSAHDTEPLLDLTSLEHPVVISLERDLFQWAMLDGSLTPIRAATRAYRTNQIDHERLQVEAAIGFLRQASVLDDPSGLTRSEIETLVARLELRKRLLGGLVGERQAKHLGQDAMFKYEQVRVRNWELLRQWADKTGLYFEPLTVAGVQGQYGMLWFSPDFSVEPAGSQLDSIWKLLNIKDPYGEKEQTPSFAQRRWFDENGALLPAETAGAKESMLRPLGVYSLDYPKQPLLLVDFRSMSHLRGHEMTQRTITEITSGIIGISHFTNWYYYAGAAVYDFVASRHGAAMDQSERLDSYSQFRSKLALDEQLDPALRNEMRSRMDVLSINPLEVSPKRELEAASARYRQLQTEAGEDGGLAKRLDKSRRKELALAAETRGQATRDRVLHELTFGYYSHRSRSDSENLAKLDTYRTLHYDLNLLDGLTDAGTRPEIAYDSKRIEDTLTELRALLPTISSPQMKARTAATMQRLRDLSDDGSLRANCSEVLAALNVSPPDRGTGVAILPSAAYRSKNQKSGRPAVETRK